jgi:hypothetical protein
MASPAAREPGPLVTLVRWRTVAKVDRAGRAQVHPVLARVVVEREQLVQIVGELRDGLGELGAIGSLERLHCRAGVVLVLGAPDLGQGLLRGRVRGLGQPGPSPGTTVSIGLYLPGRRANAGHCLRLRMITGKVHPLPGRSTGLKHCSPSRSPHRCLTAAGSGPHLSFSDSPPYNRCAGATMPGRRQMTLPDGPASGRRDHPHHPRAVMTTWLPGTRCCTGCKGLPAQRSAGCPITCQPHSWLLVPSGAQSWTLSPFCHGLPDASFLPSSTRPH